ncbi:hypothetical protein DVH24_007683 [Malus domestica]|uniref:non-specific serine/threonine protein kinase n=1 Tax=Malus domestica TaxID=3750 RepID=A0A498HM12_MALDO|nr:hypothetical protein DVH24_007683 [Malus domestica]
MDAQDFWVVIVIGFCFQVQILSSQNFTCNPNDVKALEDFTSSLKTVIDGWGSSFSSDCCKWEGITCNSSFSLGIGLNNSIDTFRVVKLELPSKRLAGNLSASLGTLDQLRTLNLSQNYLIGTLPTALFRLRNLQLLDLSFNDFSGPIPFGIDLPSIKFLDISQNLLNGTGDGISKGLFRLRKLTQLSIQDNNLAGPLSEEFGNLINLVRLDISSNGFAGTIPDVFYSLEKLQYFVAHSNRFGGQIPPSLSSSSTLSLLNLRNNSLQGSIALNCSAMISLTSLDLGSNQFDGPIPSNLPSCRHLSDVNLARNNFTGEIPENFKNFHSLSYLSLSNCSLSNISSALQILQQCHNLTTLVLTLNFHGEQFPADPTLHFEKLKVLIIAYCRLTGSIPQWLSTSSRLQLLDISWNQLEGTIPVWFGNFSSLFYLDISNNSLSGEIPRSLTGLWSFINGRSSTEEPSPDFPLFVWRVSGRGLQYNRVWSFRPTLDFSNNNLSGAIWPDFSKLRLLHVLDLKYNRLSGPIPTSLSEMVSLETLDLSHNELSGIIPPSLVDLSFLSKFSVAYNELYGVIPTGGQFLTFSSSSFEGNSLCGYDASPCPSGEDGPLGTWYGKSNKDSTGVIAGVGVGFIFGIACFVGIDRVCFCEMGVQDFWVFIFVIGFCFQARILSSQNLTCNPNDLKALEDFRNGIDSVIDGWGSKFSPDCCKWAGITCNSSSSLGLNYSIDTYRVVKLELPKRRLLGNLSASLGTLDQLRTLNLSHNFLKHLLPFSLFHLPNLKLLDLSSNDFSGPIPVDIDLPSVQFIEISYNFLNGSLPASICDSSTQLRTLKLAVNYFSGNLPPGLGNCISLEHLCLAMNNFNGSVPEGIFRLRKLTQLNIQDNKLSGALSEEFGNLSNLVRLDISTNGFSGTIPDVFHSLGRLQNFVAHSNRFGGRIPPSLSSSSTITLLNLKNNSLQGTIDLDCSAMTSLTSLDLGSNRFDGPIPSNLPSCQHLNTVNLARNNFTGEIPESFKSFHSLSYISLSNCSLSNISSALQILQQCQNLTTLPSKTRKNRGVVIGIAVGIAFGTAFVLALMFIIVVRAHSRREVDPEREDHDTNGKDLEELGSKLVVLFQNKDANKELSLDDLLQSTNNFDQANIVGCGGFGLVYKASLPDGKKVAIKRLSGDCGQMDREFCAEVETLSRAQHPNLVPLQGYCTYKSDRLLIYSYMENGSLDYWLHEKIDGPTSLDWNVRLKIAQGAARGLAYLHQSCEPHILHRDIKSSNILLDENFKAHLADFGLARLIHPYATHVTTDLVGTLGYIPPEYSQASVATYKGDVYSFGVVLLELLTGKRPMDMCKPKECRDLISWAFQMKREKKESEVFDPFICDKQHDEELLCVFEIACLCLSGSPKVRPSTQQLVTWLDNINTKKV